MAAKHAEASNIADDHTEMSPPDDKSVFAMPVSLLVGTEAEALATEVPACSRCVSPAILARASLSDLSFLASLLLSSAFCLALASLAGLPSLEGLACSFVTLASLTACSSCWESC